MSENNIFIWLLVLSLYAFLNDFFCWRLEKRIEELEKRK